jgi:two-component system, NarL family, sensor histidine kinase UhpB
MSPTRKWLWMILLAGLPAIAASQSTPRDSLIAFSLIDKAESFFSDGNYDSALHYCDLAERFSKTRNYRKGLAYSYIERTDILIDQDKLEKAGALPSLTIALGQKLNDSLIVAIATMQAAQVLMYSKKTDEALALFDKCISQYFDNHPSRYAALAYNDYAYTWQEKGDLTASASNLIKAINIYETLNLDNYGERAVALNNLSSLYFELKQLDKAIQYGKESLVYREKSGDIEKLSLGCCNISQIYVTVDMAEAKKYLDLCVKYAEQSGNDDRRIHSYVTSSQFASNQKEYKKSLEFELKAIALLEKNKRNVGMLARRYTAVGMAYSGSNGDSALAMEYYKKAIAVATGLNDKFNLRDVYLQLAIFHRNHQNFKDAYDYYAKHILYRDSLLRANTAASIAELEKKYETQKKDNEILRLNNEGRIRELQFQKQNAIIAGNRLEAEKNENEIKLLSSVKELQELKFRQQGEELEKQSLLAKNASQQLQLAEKEKQLQQQQLRDSRVFRNILIGGALLLMLLAYFMFNRWQLKKKLAQQQELSRMRSNISQNLHDDIGASLSSINILNELTKRTIGSDTAKANEYLATAGDDIQRISESLGDIVWNINPRYDDLNNLFARMNRYASDMMEGKGIEYEISFPHEDIALSLPMDKRRNFYLLFKEAVNNLAKYSKATAATIRVEIIGKTLHLLIADNGVGFAEGTQGAGNGLNNMYQRAKDMDAELVIDSKPGNGTSIRLSKML